MICWKVDKNSPLPIYKQLVNLVRDSVASGQLRKGEVLPSQRQLAKLLGLSRATIVKAMEEMTDAGLVDIKERCFRPSASWQNFLVCPAQRL